MAMLRSTASRTLGRSVASPVIRQQFRSQLCTVSRSSPLAPTKPLAAMALARYASGSSKPFENPIDSISKKAEEAIGKKRIEPTPDLVSTTSSTHAIRSELDEKRLKDLPAEEDQTEMLGGVKGDLKTIADTFSMQDVPRQALVVGFAGVLPYLATSLSTVYCAYEIHHAHVSGGGLFIDEKTAEMALHLIEPIQVGYGAVIISFLGAIHWGFEWAGYGGFHGYRRYAIGVISTAAAWPTLLMPVEYALISQFLVFNFLYYSDSRASKRGWAPQWYGIYRFVLTFVVGTAIMASLIGRGQIADKIGSSDGAAQKIQRLRDAQSEQVVEEEEARRKFLAEKEEEEEEEDDE